jgi:hypothetical protein
MMSSMKSVDITYIWMEDPCKPSRRVIVHNRSVYVDITSGYSTDSNVVRVYIPKTHKFCVYEIRYDFTNSELNEDREFVLLVRAEALG